MAEPARPVFLKKFLSGEAHFAFWDIVSKGIGFLNTFLILSALSVYQYGVFQLLLSFYALLSNFLFLGGGVVSNDIMRFVGEGREDKAKKLFLEYHGLRVFGAIVLGLFLFFGSGLLAFRYPPEMIAFAKPLALLLVFEVLFSILKSLLKMRLRFGIVASRSTLYKFFELAALLSFLSAGGLSVGRVIWAMIVGSVVSSLILLRPAYSALTHWRGRIAAPERILFRVFRHHGKWEILQQFTGKFSAFLQPWLIKIFVSTEAVAVYSVAQVAVSSFIGFFPTKTLGTLIPLEAGNADRLKRLYHLGSKYLLVFSVVLAGIAAIFVPVAVGAIFEKYLPSLPYFFLLLLHLPISALGSVTSTFMVVMRRQKHLFFQKILRSVFALPMLLFLWAGGLWGMAAYQLVFAALLFLSLYAFLKAVPPGFRIVWQDLVYFGPADKEFITRVFSEIKKRLPGRFWKRAAS